MEVCDLLELTDANQRVLLHRARPGFAPRDVRRLVGSLHGLPDPPPDPATREALLRAFRDLREST